MESLFIDLVIVVTFAEGLALALYRRVTGRGLGALDFVPNLAAGLCLMGALRCVVHASGWAWAALFLALAGLAHLIDLRARWARRESVR
jgi:hypothetical protein